uniref:FIT family protein CG10671 n=2 Tax=Lygus hesperus TaxID=30085 RepID=A0A0A9X571_LYGHE
MQAKKKTGPSKMNFRPNADAEASKGTKPTADRSSVADVLLSVFLFGCRKFLFVNTFYRVLYYLALTFLVSVVMDFAPAGKVIARKDSFLNKYFVKIGWGWTLLVALPFIYLTSFVHSCGNREKVIRSVSRLVVATVFWYVTTNFFVYVEAIYGRCNIKSAALQSKAACLGKGHFWSSVDISGHTFILIYSTLVLIEESRVINNWEGITDLLREESHTRSLDNGSLNMNPLRILDERDLNFLSTSYTQFTPYIKALFIAITGLTVIWEMMLWATVLYYHSMLEKFLAALIAVSLWYFTYYIWFPRNILISSPGEDGSFKYITTKPTALPSSSSSTPYSTIKHRKSFRRGSGTYFMGMPVKTSKEERQTDSNGQGSS